MTMTHRTTATVLNARGDFVWFSTGAGVIMRWPASEFPKKPEAGDTFCWQMSLEPDPEAPNDDEPFDFFAG
jgi:hypothetical protein